MRLMKLALVSMVLLMPACGKDSPTAPGPPPTTLPARSAISVTINPNPVIAEATGRSDFPFVARFTVVVNETAGLACNLNQISLTSLPSDTTATVWNPDDIIQRAGTNHVAARGSLSVPIGVFYRGAFGRRTVQFNIAVEAIDANNNRVTGAVVLNVL